LQPNGGWCDPQAPRLKLARCLAGQRKAHSDLRSSNSPDAKLLAYGLAEGGADWRTIKVRDIATGKELSDEVKWMRFSDISWTKDSKGFYYSRYPQPPKNKVLEAALSGQAVYYRRPIARTCPRGSRWAASG
jgi:prolyl oligopeptidase PreP (S9A serine peptidase family)